MKRSTLRIGAIVAAAAILAGCSSLDETKPSTLIPARQLNLSESLTIPAETIVAGALIFWFVDPLAPNWRVEVETLGERRFRVAMRMKRFTTGGEGEVAPVLRRTAEKLRRDKGYRDFEIVELTEGIESTVPIARRVAHAVVELR
ncbi:MAG: hypothetical protein ACXW2I_01240 [Burkholderiales bacterium]